MLNNETKVIRMYEEYEEKRLKRLEKEKEVELELLIGVLSRALRTLDKTLHKKVSKKKNIKVKVSFILASHIITFKSELKTIINVHMSEYNYHVTKIRYSYFDDCTVVFITEPFVKRGVKGNGLS